MSANAGHILRQGAWAVEAFARAQLPQAFLWAPICVAAGIGGYFSLAFEPHMPLSAWLVLVFAPLLAARCSSAVVLKALMIAASLVILGAAAATYRTASIAAPVLAEPFRGAVEGRFVASDISSSGRKRIWLDSVTLYGVEPADTPAKVRVVLTRAGDIAAFRPGDRVLLSANLNGPGPPVEAGGFDFRRYAWFRQLGAVGFATGPLMPALTQAPPTIHAHLQAQRYDISAHIRARLPDEPGGFAAAILIGDRAHLDTENLDALRASNLAHLLAISGLHMGLVTGLIFAFTRLGLAAIPRVGDRVRIKAIAAAAALVAGALYMVYSGASIATQRAFIMAAVAFGAMIVGRPALTLRAVAFAALIILLYRPESLTEPGFQMSFSATTALVAVFGVLSRQAWWTRPGGSGASVLRWMAAVLISSATAGLATAPFGAFHFNQIAQYGLLANALAVPLMGLFVMPALVLSIFLVPLGLDAPTFALAGAGIDMILWVAKWVAGMEGAVALIPKGPQAALVWVAMGGVLAVVVQGRARALGAVGVLAGLVVWGAADRPAVMIDPKGALVGIMEGGKRGLSASRGSGLAATVWLENDADPAGQKEAAQRLDRAKYPPEAVLVISGTNSAPLSVQAYLDPFDAVCPTHGIILDLDGLLERAKLAACPVVGKDFLAEHGAVSIYAKRNGPELITSRQIVGARPWSEARAAQ